MLTFDWGHPRENGWPYLSSARDAFITTGRPSPSITRDEQAAQRAAWERYEAADAEEASGTAPP